MAACITEDCIEETRPGSKLPQCKNCRAGVKRWEKRPLGHRRERARKLHVYSQRVAQAISDVKKGAK